MNRGYDLGLTHFSNHDPSAIARDAFLDHCLKIKDFESYIFGVIGPFVLNRSGPRFVISYSLIKGQFWTLNCLIPSSYMTIKGVRCKIGPVPQH